MTEKYAHGPGIEYHNKQLWDKYKNTIGICARLAIFLIIIYIYALRVLHAYAKIIKIQSFSYILAGLPGFARDSCSIMHVIVAVFPQFNV